MTTLSSITPNTTQLFTTLPTNTPRIVHIDASYLAKTDFKAGSTIDKVMTIALSSLIGTGVGILTYCWGLVIGIKGFGLTPAVAIITAKIAAVIASGATTLATVRFLRG